jgi:hypothetical protein
VPAAQIGGGAGRKMGRCRQCRERRRHRQQRDSVLGGEGGKGKIFWCRSVQREGNIRIVCVGPGAEGGKGKYFCPGRCSVVTQREGGRKKNFKDSPDCQFSLQNGMCL